jgi:hypothetical protein
MLILAAFICGFVMDLVWTLCVAAVAKHKPQTAAHFAVLIYLCTMVSTLLIVNSEWLPMGAFVAGSWLGTYSTVKWWVT